MMMLLVGAGLSAKALGLSELTRRVIVATEAGVGMAWAVPSLGGGAAAAFSRLGGGGEGDGRERRSQIRSPTTTPTAAEDMPRERAMMDSRLRGAAVGWFEVAVVDEAAEVVLWVAVEEEEELLLPWVDEGLPVAVLVGLATPGVVEDPEVVLPAVAVGLLLLCATLLVVLVGAAPKLGVTVL